METWDVQRTAEWLCQVGRLNKKYAITCEEKGISGRALLLLASGSENQLMTVLDLKMGPQKILMKRLEPYLIAFKESNTKAVQRSKPLKEWNVEELSSWLRELVLPEECITLVEREEIDGEAFMLLIEDGELKDSLQLKEEPWILLQHEFSLLVAEHNELHGLSNQKNPQYPAEIAE